MAVVTFVPPSPAGENRAMPTVITPEKAPSDSDSATRDFVALLGASLDDDTFSRLLLGRRRGDADALPERIAVRRLTVRGEPQLSFVQHHLRRDVTKNVPLAEAIGWVGELLRDGFGHAHLITVREDIQWSLSRKGKPGLRRGKLPGAAPTEPDDRHDRQKQRQVDIRKPFLQALGVTDAEHRLVPSMARKWKQINKFIEVFAQALGASALNGAERISVLDFGSGKGYLTFAVHDYLASGLGVDARVSGVDLRDDMVALCRDAAQRLGLVGLEFVHGDVRSVAPASVDVMIALHACDTATDHAIHRGIRAGAAIILCSPCCHQEIRPQMHSPEPLRPMLQHGIHLGQQAEMVTDSLRALLLDAHGYESRVFEFVSLEHTSKNKMILAVRRATACRRDEALGEIAAIKAFYGIRNHCLEALLAADETPTRAICVAGR